MARFFAFLSLLTAVLVAAQAAAAAEPASGSPIVFTRATAGSLFLSWAAAGARTDAVLVMYDTDGQPVATYHVENAWPSKISAGSLDAAGNEISIESIEISHDGIRLDVLTDSTDPDAAYLTNGITGTVSFADRRTRGVLYPLRLPLP
jgi:sugar lactone lactonase YvrE